MKTHINYLIILLFTYSIPVLPAASSSTDLQDVLLVGKEGVPVSLPRSVMAYARFFDLTQSASEISVDRYTAQELATAAVLLKIRAGEDRFDELTRAYQKQLPGSAAILQALEAAEYFGFDSNAKAALGHVFAQRKCMDKPPEEEEELQAYMKTLSLAQKRKMLPFIASAYYQAVGFDRSKLPETYARYVDRMHKRTARSGINSIVLEGVKKLSFWRSVRCNAFTFAQFVTLSSDQTLFALSNITGIIKIWDMQNGQEAKQPVIDPSHTLLFRPGTHQLLTVSKTAIGKHSAAKIWDLDNSPEPIHLFLYPIDKTINRVAYSPNGLKLASGANSGEIYVHDVASNYTMFNTLCGHKNLIWAIAFNFDGSLLASGDHDGKVLVWDPAEEMLLGVNSNPEHSMKLIKYTPQGRRVKAHFPNPVETITFSCDGKKVIFGSADSHIRIWDWQVLKPKNEITAIHMGRDRSGSPIRISSILCTPCGSMIVAALSDCSIAFLSSDDYRKIHTEQLRYDMQPLSLAVTDDSGILAAGCQNGLLTWKLPAAQAVELPYLQYAVIQRALKDWSGKRKYTIADMKTSRVVQELPIIFKQANLFAINPEITQEVNAETQRRRREVLINKAKVFWLEQKPYIIGNLREGEVYDTLPQEYKDPAKFVISERMLRELARKKLSQASSSSSVI